MRVCLAVSLTLCLLVCPSVCLPVSHFVAAGWFISRHLQQHQQQWHQSQQRKKRPCPRLRRGRETFRADRWNFLTTDLFTFKQFHRPDQSVWVRGAEGGEGSVRHCKRKLASTIAGLDRVHRLQQRLLYPLPPPSSCFVCYCCLAGTED